MKLFSEGVFVDDVGNTCWESVLVKQEPVNALDMFNSLFSQKHAPLKKFAVSRKQSPCCTVN